MTEDIRVLTLALADAMLAVHDWNPTWTPCAGCGLRMRQWVPTDDGQAPYRREISVDANGHVRIEHRCPACETAFRAARASQGSEVLEVL